MNSRTTHSKFVCPLCRIRRVINILSACQLHFLANKNGEPGWWQPVNCIIGEQVALLSGPTVYSLCCVINTEDVVEDGFHHDCVGDDDA